MARPSAAASPAFGMRGKPARRRTGRQGNRPADRIRGGRTTGAIVRDSPQGRLPPRSGQSPDRAPSPAGSPARPLAIARFSSCDSRSLRPWSRRPFAPGGGIPRRVGRVRPAVWPGRGRDRMAPAPGRCDGRPSPAGCGGVHPLPASVRPDAPPGPGGAGIRPGWLRPQPSPRPSAAKPRCGRARDGRAPARSGRSRRPAPRTGSPAGRPDGARPPDRG